MQASFIRTLVGSLVSLAALALIAFFPSPSLAEPPLLTEAHFLPGDVTPSPAAARQTSPEIAAGAGMYLVVWVDNRTSLTDINNFFGGPGFQHHTGSM